MKIDKEIDLVKIGDTKQKHTPRQVGKPLKKETVIYIGPTLPCIVSAGTVFTNGIPKKLENAIVELPVTKSLLVPLDKLVEARKELKMQNSALSIFYKIVAKHEFGKGE